MENQIIFTIIIAIIIWLSIISYYLYRVINHYNRLTSVTGRENITEILNEILSQLEHNKKNIVDLEKVLNGLKLDGLYHFQKAGLLRYNPFEDTGGDQSFILALMDGTDTGVILTSLHNRGVTRWYAKKIVKGKGVDMQLSEEEKKVIKQATESG